MPLLYPRIPLDQPRYSYHPMLSAYSPIASPTTPCVATGSGRVTQECAENVLDFDDSSEAMDELYNLVVSTMQPSAPIILRCNLPTLTVQSPSTDDFGLDLYDLRALHAKSLVLVHGLIERLTAAGYQASYKLTISNATRSCSLVRVTSGDPYTALPQTELDKICSTLKQKLELAQRNRLYVTTLCNLPSLVIT